MLTRGLRGATVVRALTASTRGGGGHWHRPDVPKNVEWIPERQPRDALFRRPNSKRIIGCGMVQYVQDGTLEPLGNYVASGDLQQDLYNHGKTAKIAAQKDFFGTEYTNQQGLIVGDYTLKNGGADFRSTKAANNSKKVIADATSWWDRVNVEAEKAARAQLASGKVGHHH